MSNAHTWEYYCESAYEAFEEEAYYAALEAGTKAYQLAQAEFGEDTLNYVDVLSILASIHSQLEQNEEALTFHQQLHALGKEIWENDAEAEVDFLNEMAVCYIEVDDLKSAEGMLNQALQIGIESLEEDADGNISTLYNLGECWQAMQQPEKVKSAFDGLAKILLGMDDDVAPEYQDIWEALATYYEETGEPIKRISVEVGLLLAIAESEGKQSNLYLKKLERLGADCTEHREYDLAQQYLDENLALRKAKFGENSKSYAIALRLKGRLLEGQGEYEDALACLQEALSRYEALANPQADVRALIMIDLASVQMSRHEFEEAEQQLISARELLESCGKLTEYVSFFDESAMLYQFMGDYPKAEASFRELMEILGNRGQTQSREYDFLYIKLARILSQQGKYPEADKAFLSGMDGIEGLVGKNHVDYAWALGEQANHFRILKQADRELRCSTQQYKIYKDQLGDAHPETLGAVQNMVRIFLDMGIVEGVEEILQETLEAAQKGNSDETAHSALLQLMGKYYSLTQQYPKAEKHLSKARDLMEKGFGKEHPAYVSSLSNLGGLYQDQGQYEAAVEQYRAALTLCRTLFDPYHLSLANALNNLANGCVRIERYEEALDLFIELSELYLHQIKTLFPIQSEHERTYLFDQFRFAFGDFNQLATLLNQEQPALTEKMYDYWLAIKGLLFYSTSQFKQFITSSTDEALKEKYESWLSQKKYWATRYDHTQHDEDHHRYLIQLEQTINQAEKELATEIHGIDPLQVIGNHVWQDIQQHLQADGVAIEIIRLADLQQIPGRYVALLIHPKSQRPTLIEIGENQLLEKQALPVFQEQDRINRGERSSFVWEGGASESQEARTNLYQHFWKPVAEELKRMDISGRVYLSLDGFYHEFNLNILQHPTTETYVLDEWDITLVSSTRDVLNPATQAPPQAGPHKAVLMGYPTYYMGPGHTSVSSVADFPPGDHRFLTDGIIQDLPGTRIEVESIGKLLSQQGWHTEVLTERKANEHALKNVERPTVLHLATHGFFLQSGTTKGPATQDVPVHPLFHTGLLLAGAGTSKEPKQEGVFIAQAGHEDGWFSAYEAALLNLKDTELVVLSACETGRGIQRNSEGLYGFQRAFLEAGAKCLLSSLWKVDDAATQEMMQLFYQFWLKGKSKRGAFRAAQQALRKHYPAPYYWGAFVMVGE